MLAMPLGTRESAVEPAIQRDTIWKRVAHMNCWRPCFGALLYKRGTRRTEGSCGYPTSLDRIYHKSPCNEFHGCRIPSHLVDGFGKFIGKDDLMALPSGLASGWSKKKKHVPRCPWNQWAVSYGKIQTSIKLILYLSESGFPEWTRLQSPIHLDPPSA